eukprot:scaffold967_cov173-Ochromonas_danica.AAC.6
MKYNRLGSSQEPFSVTQSLHDNSLREETRLYIALYFFYCWAGVLLALTAVHGILLKRRNC